MFAIATEALRPLPGVAEQIAHVAAARRLARCAVAVYWRIRGSPKLADDGGDRCGAIGVLE
jgi:hypothetical protein